ncbi:hypothetical protein NHP21005_12840 [Helicobacter sp. NHP21005]|uniref:hypothetical protein n=1 Tax=Helicobacter felistomachi TaxID=3040201 RepID=UPI002573CDB2|nr:hypothetical protein [Helicobacter sp. NHP21005]BEG57596.1 hypothetical protein NHP21005_12840 [Helicobacter sp. NHP21005]
MQKWLFSFILSGLPLMAYNPKDGYFIEGGITTGLVESEEELATSPTLPAPPLPPNTQNQPNNNPIPPNNSNEIPKITQEQYLKSAAPTFTQNQLTDSQTPVTMSTTDPIEITLKNGQLHIESFLPYNLTNVDLYMTNKEGQKVLVGQFADIDPFMRTTLSTNLMPKIDQILNQPESTETTPIFAATPYTPTFNLKTTSASSDQTTKVFQDLSQIWVDLNLRFVPIGGLDSTRWGVLTPLSAELLSDVFLDLAAVLSSNAFKTAVLNVPFALTSGPNSYNPNVVPKANGALPDPPTPPAKPADLNDPQDRPPNTKKP